MNFYQKYLEQLKADFPISSCENKLSELLSPNLISAQKLFIEAAALEKIKRFVAAMFKLRSTPEYQSPILASHPLFEHFNKPQNFSALMSYDFHLLDQQNPKLIEINTNASSSLIINESYRVNQIKNIFSPAENFESEILHCFENEFRLFNPNRELKVIAILDEAPASQKLYLEFLLYQELFKLAGYTCVIADPKDLHIKAGQLIYQSHLPVDLVYNRHTDFYFSTAACAHLREAYRQGVACFSPHPFEYALLADKQRLFELSQDKISLASLLPQEKQIVEQVILKSYDISKSEDKDWFWHNKKNLFFKPMRSFGGKAAYRGQGVTQGVFAKIIAGQYLAQEFAPPPLIEVQLEDSTRAEFKYDLRFYVYKDRIQLGVARLWQGQMTNISTPGGGLTPILLKPNC